MYQKLNYVDLVLRVSFMWSFGSLATLGNGNEWMYVIMYVYMHECHTWEKWERHAFVISQNFVGIINSKQNRKK